MSRIPEYQDFATLYPPTIQFNTTCQVYFIITNYLYIPRMEVTTWLKCQQNNRTTQDITKSCHTFFIFTWPYWFKPNVVEIKNFEQRNETFKTKQKLQNVINRHRAEGHGALQYTQSNAHSYCTRFIVFEKRHCHYCNVDTHAKISTLFLLCCLAMW